MTSRFNSMTRQDLYRLAEMAFILETAADAPRILRDYFDCSLEERQAVLDEIIQGTLQ